MANTTTKPSFVHDALLRLMDDIEALPDPAVRLAAYAFLLDDVKQHVLAARNRTAYEARKMYAQEDIQRISGSDIKEVYYWCDRHVRANGLERLPNRRRRADLTDVLDVRDALALQRNTEAEGRPSS
jgi:hypothetical protein